VNSVLRWAAASILAALLAAACDNTFEPIAPGGPPFSVFGYLDASADTQWIRVTPLRTLLRGSAEPLGVAVTLDDLGSGRIIALRDTAMRYPNVLGEDSLYAHNFWTAERIEPGAAYRFRAAGHDGALAESVVQVPPDYDVEVWVNPYRRAVRTEGLKQPVFIFWNTTYYDGCLTSWFFRKIQHVTPGDDSLVQMIPIPEYSRELPTCGRGSVTITRQDAEVVAISICHSGSCRRRSGPSTPTTGATCSTTTSIPLGASTSSRWLPTRRWCCGADEASSCGGASRHCPRK
jgi:hypothetical protein